MLKIEILEQPFILDGKEKRYFGDVLTLEKNKAQLWIDLGWAKDLETGESGKRVAGATKLNPDNTKAVVG